MKILVVDDNSAIREAIETLMVIKGYESISAQNGMDALELLNKQSDIDVVITDVLMPEMDGLALYGHIKTSYPQVKVIAISGGSTYRPASGELQKCLEAGVKYILEKPFTLAKLAQMLEE